MNADLEHKLSELETRWHDSQKLMDRAKYILMRNPHATRGKDEVDRITRTMDSVHAEFQRVLQRQSVLGVSQTEHVLDAYCQVFRPTAWHFNVLMDSFRRHQPMQCSKLIDRMDREGVEPDTTTFNILLEAMTFQHSSMEEVEAVLADMTKRDLKIDNVTRSLMLTVLAMQGKVELVEQSMASMIQRGELPTVGCLTAVMSMYGKHDLVSKGNEVRLSLLKGDYELLGRHYSEILRYCIRSNDTATLEEVWDSMEAKGFRAADDVFSSYLKLLLKGAAKDGHVSTALKENLSALMQRAENCSVRLNLMPALPTFIQLVSDKRNDLLEHIVQALVISTPNARDATYTSLCSFFRQSGDTDAIINILDILLKTDISAQIVGNMLLSAGVQKTTEGTRKLLQYLLKQNTPVYKESLFALVYAFSNRLDALGCKEALEAMKSLGIEPSEHVLNACLSAYINTNSPPDEITAMFDEMVTKGMRVYVANAQTLIVMCSSRGDARSCICLFPMLRFEGRVPTFLEYTSYINVLISVGDADLALSALADMKRVGHAPTPKLVSSLVFSLATRCRYADADHVLEQNADVGPLPILESSNMIAELAERGMIQKFERLCMLVEKSGTFPSAFALTAMIRAYGKSYQVDRARSIYVIMEGRGIGNHPKTQAAMLYSLSHSRLLDESVAWVCRMRDLNIPMPDDALTTLLHTCIYARAFSEFEQVFAVCALTHVATLTRLLKSIVPMALKHDIIDRIKHFVCQVAGSREVADTWTMTIDTAVKAELASRRPRPSQPPPQPQQQSPPSPSSPPHVQEQSPQPAVKHVQPEVPQPPPPPPPQAQTQSPPAEPQKQPQQQQPQTPPVQGEPAQRSEAGQPETPTQSQPASEPPKPAEEAEADAKPKKSSFWFWS